MLGQSSSVCGIDIHAHWLILAKQILLRTINSVNFKYTTYSSTFFFEFYLDFTFLFELHLNCILFNET